MNRIDFTNLKGFPLCQDDLDFMNQNYLSAFAAIAKLCGSKTILWGVEHIGSNVTDGWISYNGELIQFIGGTYAAKVVITETPVPLTFGDNVAHDVIYTKTATCGVSGAFDYSELVPLRELQNVWMPGDLKMKNVDATYVAANFNGTGYGINREVGWRIFSYAVPGSAGKVFVNLDLLDTDFNIVGNTGGEKAHTLMIAEMPAHTHDEMVFQAVNNGGLKPAGFLNTTGSLTNSGSVTGSRGGGGAHNNLQPYYVILTLIKL